MLGRSHGKVGKVQHFLPHVVGLDLRVVAYGNEIVTAHPEEHIVPGRDLPLVNVTDRLTKDIPPEATLG